MKILIDLDGVIADFEKAFYEEWYNRHPDKTIVLPEERTKFYIRDEHPEVAHLIREIYNMPGFFLSFPVIPGSIEALKEMLNRGHEVFICSSPSSENDNCIPEKIRWIKEHLGNDFIRRIIITKDKTLVKGDVLIDDRPEVTGVAKPEWELIIFDRPYNKHIKDRKRITWDNWQNILDL